MVLLINIILLLTMHTNAGEGEDGMEGEVMKRGLKKLKIAKGGRYATPFDATKNTPMKGDGKSDGRNRRYGGDMSPARKAIVVRIHEGAREGGNFLLSPACYEK